MNKCLFVFLISVGLISCTPKNKAYYQSHPQELQKAIKACPQQQPAGLTCEQLEALAKRMNSLAYELQLSPQRFGQQILLLQETLAKEQDQLNKEKSNAELEQKIETHQQDLSEYLAVVKWLESPVS